MGTFNLLRNSRVFFTTNVNASTRKVNLTTHTAATTKEIQVLDGFTFSQTNNADTIQINEAGLTPTRGQRSFNTALNNVEFSFSTYLRPKLVSTLVEAEEDVLWNALFSDTAISTTGITPTGTLAAPTYSNTTGELTLTGATAIPGVTVGEVVTVSGITGTGASLANMPGRVVSFGANTVLKLLSPPSTALTLGGTTYKVHKGAWTRNAAVATDTVEPAKAYSQVTTGPSNRNQLQLFGMIIMVDGIAYQLNDCVLDQASIDFSIDGIATIAWTGKAATLEQIDTAVTATSANTATNTFGGGVTGVFTSKVTDAKFITNKLSTVTLQKDIGGSATVYTLALTGGNITIANNVTYVTPANLGVVNVPVTYFTGTRSITGNITAYLRTGALNTAGLLDTLLGASATSEGVEPKYMLEVDIGGRTAGTRVQAHIFGAMLQIPTIDAQAVLSTTINFNAQGSVDLGTNNVAGATAQYEIENTNELRIRYFAD